MPFHHEWAWYNINYPNPEGAICRLGMKEADWQRMTRWRDFDWFKEGALLNHRILMNKQESVDSCTCPSKCKISPHLLPPAGVPSVSHARRHPMFYFELFHRMLMERECLVRQGLLPPDIPGPFPPPPHTHARYSQQYLPATPGSERPNTQMCRCAADDMMRRS